MDDDPNESMTEKPAIARTSYTRLGRPEKSDEKEEAAALNAADDAAPPAAPAKSRIMNHARI